MPKERFTLGYEADRSGKGIRLGTLWANVEYGEGDVTLSLDGFADKSTLFRLDVLRDWISLLEREYDVTLDERNKELMAFPRDKNGECE
jgi:hypothetical protein